MREEEYFDYLEKKENMETKMATLTELRVNVVHCKTVSQVLFGVSSQPLSVVCRST